MPGSDSSVSPESSRSSRSRPVDGERQARRPRRRPDAGCEEVGVESLAGRLEAEPAEHREERRLAARRSTPRRPPGAPRAARRGRTNAAQRSASRASAGAGQLGLGHDRGAAAGVRDANRGPPWSGVDDQHDARLAELRVDRLPAADARRLPGGDLSLDRRELLVAEQLLDLGRDRERQAGAGARRARSSARAIAATQAAAAIGGQSEDPGERVGVEVARTGRRADRRRGGG